MSLSMNVSVAVKAPPHVVWELITDLDNCPNVVSSIVGIERVGDKAGEGGFQVGTRWRETREIWGTKDTIELFVTAIDSYESTSFPKSYSVEGDAHGAHYKTVFKVESDESGRESQLTMDFGGTPCNLLSRVMAFVTGPCTKGSTIAMMQKDVDELAKAAEDKHAANPPKGSSITVSKFMNKPAKEVLDQETEETIKE